VNHILPRRTARPKLDPTTTLPFSQRCPSARFRAEPKEPKAVTQLTFRRDGFVYHRSLRKRQKGGGIHKDIRQGEEVALWRSWLTTLNSR